MGGLGGAALFSSCHCLKACVMRLSAALKGSRIVGVIHVVLLTWVYIIRFVCILVGGRT